MSWLQGYNDKCDVFLNHYLITWTCTFLITDRFIYNRLVRNDMWSKLHAPFSLHDRLHFKASIHCITLIAPLLSLKWFAWGKNTFTITHIYLTGSIDKFT